ncbi:MAG: class I SAM-dependent methyltransferase [Ornithinimicrobium sp.]
METTTDTTSPSTPTTNQGPTVDEAAVEAFVGRLLTDIAGSSTTLMTIVGDRLGLYEALTGAGPTRADTLAEVTGLNERLVTEWLAAQTVAEYVRYDPDTSTYELPAEHAAVLSVADSPAYIVAATAIVGGLFSTLDHLEQAFRGDGGIEIYDALDEHARFGVERFFQTAYTHELASPWFPAVDGLVERMEGGARVADVGSGHGPSSIAMATTWPRSTVIGFDAHSPSVTISRARAIEAGNPANLSFRVADAAQIGPGPFDVVTFFDSLHDMGDPLAALRRAHALLEDDGIVVAVEPWSLDRLEDGIGDPRTRMDFGISTAMCTPGSLAQPGAYGLGTQGGPTRRLELLTEAGFRDAALVIDTGFNLVLAARR